MKLETIIKKGKRISQPDFVPPMLATLTDEYFSATIGFMNINLMACAVWFSKKMEK